MFPKILVLAKSESFANFLCQCLKSQYDIIYEGFTLKDNTAKVSERKIYLCIIESSYFTEEYEEVIQRIKEKLKSPILFVSGMKPRQQRIKEKVWAIECGVDEYLAQPQSMEEILASVKALIRLKLRTDGATEEWTFRELRLLPGSRQAYLNGKELPFTKIEYDIVHYLASQDGRVVTYKELYENVWKHKYIYDDVNIMSHIHRIRKKLEQNQKKPEYIHNVYGVGYRFGDKVLSASAGDIQQKRDLCLPELQARKVYVTGLAKYDKVIGVKELNNYI